MKFKTGDIVTHRSNSSILFYVTNVFLYEIGPDNMKIPMLECEGMIDTKRYWKDEFQYFALIQRP